jgi:hypothetical protein
VVGATGIEPVTDPAGREPGTRGRTPVAPITAGRATSTRTGYDAPRGRRFAPGRTQTPGWPSSGVVLGAGTWRDPSLALETFAVYSTRWIAERDLKPQTRGENQRILDKHLLPRFGGTAMASITPTMVRSGYATLPKARRRCARTSTRCCARSCGPRWPTT